MIEIIPAIMPKTIEEAREKAGMVSSALSLQLDLMDGIFVPEKTFPFVGSEHMEPLDIGMFELDLMVKNASERIPLWLGLGASRLIFHMHAEESLLDNLDIYKDILVGVERGIAVAVDTPMEEVDTLVPYVDFVQFMGIEKIGFQGEPFSEKVIEQIQSFKKAYPDITVSVDGGVSEENIHILKNIGVERAVMGSAIFGKGSAEENLARLEEFVNRQ